MNKRSNKLSFGIVFRETIKRCWIAILIGGFVGAVAYNAFSVYKSGEEWWLMFTWSIIPILIGCPIGLLLVALFQYIELRIKNK